MNSSRLVQGTFRGYVAGLPNCHLQPSVSPWCQETVQVDCNAHRQNPRKYQQARHKIHCRVFQNCHLQPSVSPWCQETVQVDCNAHRQNPCKYQHARHEIHCRVIKTAIRNLVWVHGVRRQFRLIATHIVKIPASINKPDTRYIAGFFKTAICNRVWVHGVRRQFSLIATHIVKIPASINKPDRRFQERRKIRCRDGTFPPARKAHCSVGRVCFY